VHIDALRAIAVLVVVVAHAGLGNIIPGGTGVTIFFAISGFIITTLLLKERNRSGGFDVRGFYVRRAVKLLPPLIVVIVIPTLIISVWSPVEWKALIGQVFFFFNWQKIAEPGILESVGPLSGSGVVWSLSIEEQFYIVIAILWVLIARHQKAVTWLAVLAIGMILVSTVERILLAESGNQIVSDRIYYGSDTRADSLAWGILAAILLYRWKQGDIERSLAQRFSGSAWSLVLALSIILLSVGIRADWFQQTFRYSMQSVAACILVIYGFTASRGGVQRVFDAVCRNRLLQVIGLASYSVYLVHLILIRLIQSSTLSPHVETVLGVFLAVGVGVGIYWVVEVPSRWLYDRYRARGGERVPLKPDSVHAV